MDGDGARQVAELEREIEETREQLDHTFDQLEERLTMDHFMGEVRGRLNETAHALLDAVEQHPSAVIGVVALGAILLRRRHLARSRSLAGIELSAEDLLRLIQARMASAASQASDAAQNGSRTLGQYASDAVQSGSQTLGRYASDVGQHAGDLLQQAGGGLSEVAQQAREHGAELLEQLRETDLRPALPYGLLALAIAAGIGLARARRH
jgi:hypothetical protein